MMALAVVTVPMMVVFQFRANQERTQIETALAMMSPSKPKKEKEWSSLKT